MTSLQSVLVFVSLAAVCGAGGRPTEGKTYPTGEDVLPDVTLDGLDERGAATTVRTRDYFVPEIASPPLLVVRFDGGAWCGTCLWHAHHTAALLEGRHIQLLDVVLGSRENDTPSRSDAERWRGELDTRSLRIAIDPSFALRAVVPEGRMALPIFLAVDVRTMKIVRTLGNPDPSLLEREMDEVLASLEGRSPPARPREALVDGLFHANEWDMIRAITTPDAPPPDKTNEVADDPRGAALGKALFSDTGLSPSGKVACVTCHDASHDLGDARPRAVGLAEGKRHTPRIALAAFSPTQFWDGRASSLAEQAAGPIEARDEMGSSPAFVAQHVAEQYTDAYRDLFPDASLSDPSQVLVNVSKALAAHERTFRVRPNRLDRYTAGDLDALTFPEKQGLAMFARMGCMQCHWGSRLTDDAFHVTRRDDSDPGRNGTHAFKTPSLRGVAESAFFGHRGDQASLTQVLDDYGSAAAPGAREPWLPRFGETTRWSIGRFLQTLSGVPIVR